MGIIWTKKNYFFRRRALSQATEYGELELNGKKLAIYFVEERDIIEVTHQDNGTEVFPLDEDERIMLIEALLKEYTTFFKSIVHASTRHYFETYSLVDTSNIVEPVPVEELEKGDKTILDEFLDSEYAKQSTNNLFLTLYEIDKFLVNTKFLKERPVYYEVKNKLNLEQWMDLKYFVDYILHRRLMNDCIKFEVCKKIATIKFTFEEE